MGKDFLSVVASVKGPFKGLKRGLARIYMGLMRVIGGLTKIKGGLRYLERRSPKMRPDGWVRGSMRL